MSYLTDSDKEQIIKYLYPDLLYYQERKLYFYDKSISSAPIKDYYLGHQSNTSQYSIRANTMKYTLIIDTLVRFNRDHPSDLEYSSIFSHRGKLELNLDYKLSDESCMALYTYDIVISSKHNEFDYNRQAIERSHTINKIINDTINE